jgi:hypothetical protein
MHTASALVAREKLFNMRMSAEEWARLEGLATHYGLNAAGVLRMLVKADADRLAAAKAEEPRPRDKGRKK